MLQGNELINSQLDIKFGGGYSVVRKSVGKAARARFGGQPAHQSKLDIKIVGGKAQGCEVVWAGLARGRQGNDSQLCIKLNRWRSTMPRGERQ